MTTDQKIKEMLLDNDLEEKDLEFIVTLGLRVYNKEKLVKRISSQLEEDFLINRKIIKDDITTILSEVKNE